MRGVPRPPRRAPDYLKITQPGSSNHLLLNRIICLKSQTTAKPAGAPVGLRITQPARGRDHRRRIAAASGRKRSPNLHTFPARGSAHVAALPRGHNPTFITTSNATAARRPGPRRSPRGGVFLFTSSAADLALFVSVILRFVQRYARGHFSFAPLARNFPSTPVGGFGGCPPVYLIATTTAEKSTLFAFFPTAAMARKSRPRRQTTTTTTTATNLDATPKTRYNWCNQFPLERRNRHESNRPGLHV